MERADPVAMTACDPGSRWPEVAPRRLQDLPMPLFLAWGGREVSQDAAAAVPSGARVVIVAGEDHVGAFRRSDILLPDLRAFLAAARRAPASPIA